MEQNSTKSNINWYPGHMTKARREIKEKLELIDIVYEIIDARMPKSSRIVDLDEIVKGNQELLKDINKKREEKGLNKRVYRALVIGVPNVGKSTLINRLAGRNMQEVGNRAGVTKNLSWIKINKNIELLDTPGILWPKIEDIKVGYNLASLTSIKEEILDKEEIASYIIRFLYENYPNILKDKYAISEIDNDLTNTFDIIGRKRGCLMKGNIIDYEKVYSLIINDLKEGKIKNVTFDRL